MTGAGQHVVFLQGMSSAFFTRAAEKLAARGCRATKVNFCIGDRLFWRGPHAIEYRGRFSDWPAFIGSFFEKEKVTDLVVLGDQREYHKRAIAAARERGVRVAVIDFGYLRPDWLTLERDGKGGNSKFPKNPDDIRRLAAAAPPADLAGRYSDNFWTMARGDLLYSFSNVFFGWLYPRYSPHDTRPHPLIYFPAMGLRLLFAGRNQRDGSLLLQQLIDKKSRYFVFPLQLGYDTQILAYSPFPGMEQGVRAVMKSFAAQAPAGTRLAIKSHPWDPCLTNWKKLVPVWAQEYGMKDRVDYFDGGDLDKMITNSAGMITVNSTSGIRALQLGSPVKVLGDAIYDMPGLTHQADLASFWSRPVAPDAALMKSFIDVLADTIQIRGVFFTDPGLTAAAEALAERLSTETVGKGRAER